MAATFLLTDYSETLISVEYKCWLCGDLGSGRLNVCSIFRIAWSETLVITFHGLEIAMSCL